MDNSKRSDNQGGPKPMKPAGFHILLVLAASSSHGLGIAKAVDEATDGAVTLGPGTLYRSLKELMGEMLIQEIDPPDGPSDPRRRLYEITPTGLDRARAEARRLERLVEVAHQNAVLPGS
jgi:DNA-binding PadR family transcriptional regulator